MTRPWPGPVAQLLPDQVVQTILDRIANGELLPGYRLSADCDTSQSLNREIPLAFAAAAQNKMLEDLVAPLLDVRFAGTSRHFTHETCRRTWAAHHTIQRAEAAHDAMTADRAIRDHFEIGPIALTEIEAHSRAAEIALRWNQRNRA